MYSSGKLKNIILVEIFEIVAKPQKLKKEVDFFFGSPCICIITEMIEYAYRTSNANQKWKFINQYNNLKN